MLFVKILVAVMAILCIFISLFHFKEKGCLFNNAFLYASKKERDLMNKKPYYRQSAIVFFLLGAMFFTLEMELITEKTWIYSIFVVLFLILLIYVVISSIKIGKSDN